MRFTSALLLSLFAPNSAFVLHSQNPFVRRLMTLGSTLAPDTPDLRVAENDSHGRGALSMQIDELAEVLGGKESAQIVWDCYALVSVDHVVQYELSLINPSGEKGLTLKNSNYRALNLHNFMGMR